MSLLYSKKLAHRDYTLLPAAILNQDFLFDVSQGFLQNTEFMRAGSLKTMQKCDTDKKTMTVPEKEHHQLLTIDYKCTVSSIQYNCSLTRCIVLCSTVHTVAGYWYYTCWSVSPLGALQGAWIAPSPLSTPIH